MCLLKFTDICVDIGEKAAKEYNIETMLSEMYEIWKEKQNVFIIKGYNEIQAIVDEHIVNTHNAVLTLSKAISGRYHQNGISN